MLDGNLPTVTFEVLVTFFRKDGSRITIPGAVVCTIEDGLFIDQRIYADISPVFAPVASDALFGGKHPADTTCAGGARLKQNQAGFQRCGSSSASGLLALAEDKRVSTSRK